MKTLYRVNHTYPLWKYTQAFIGVSETEGIYWRPLEWEYTGPGIVSMYLSQRPSHINENRYELNYQEESYEHVVPYWALSYLINGDATGLEDDDEEAVTEFEKNTMEVYGIGHWEVDPEEHPDFAPDNDVTLLADECIRALYVVINRR